VANDRVFIGYTLASALATAITQVVLVGFAVLTATPPVTASALAFLAGAVPHFLIVRRWAHGTLPRQLSGYLLVTVAGGVASTGVVALVDTLLGPMITQPGLHAVALNLGYLVGGAPIFLAKFAVLDRALFARRASAYRAASSTRVRAAKPVAPGVISS
jgi:putative flippase GtrA